MARRSPQAARRRPWRSLASSRLILEGGMPMLHELREPSASTGEVSARGQNGSGDTLISLLIRNAKEAPSRIAIRERELGIWREYSWAVYLSEVTTLAAGLEALGLGAREPVVVIGDNRARLYF